jgi:hypothetical protein
MRAYRDIEVSEADIHLWQQCNPVVTEALVQLTWGGPQVIYNGACSGPGSATTTPVGGVPAVTEHHAEVRAPWLTVRLPASTRVRLTLTLALRTRPPSYTTPFGGDLGLLSQAPASPTASRVAVPRSVRNRSIHPNGPWCEPRSWF